MNLFIDDRCIIPEEIRNMSKDQIKNEIERLEKEAKEEKEKRLKNQYKI